MTVTENKLWKTVTKCLIATRLQWNVSDLNGTKIYWCYTTQLEDRSNQNKILYYYFANKKRINGTVELNQDLFLPWAKKQAKNHQYVLDLQNA